MLRMRARRAAVIHRFNWLPREVAVLTDKQIEELCYHHTDDEGRICLPPDLEIAEMPALEVMAPKGLKEHLADLETLKNYLGAGLDQAAAEKAKADLIAKYGEALTEEVAEE